MVDRYLMIITIVIAIAAFLSPIVTALINNRHQRKMRLVELERQRTEEITLHSREIIEEYLRFAGEALLRQRTVGSSISVEYHKAYFRVLFNASSNLQKLIQEANQLILERNTDIASEKLSEIAALARVDFFNSYSPTK